MKPHYTILLAFGAVGLAITGIAIDNPFVTEVETQKQSTHTSLPITHDGTLYQQTYNPQKTINGTQLQNTVAEE